MVEIVASIDTFDALIIRIIRANILSKDPIPCVIELIISSLRLYLRIDILFIRSPI